MSTPTADWYPDPRDPTKQRWWDGERWTAQVQDAPASAAATPAAAAPDGSPGTPATALPTDGASAVGGRGRILAVSALVAVLLVGAGAVTFLVTRSGDQPPALTVGDQGPDATAEDDRAESPTDDDRTVEFGDTGDGSGGPSSTDGEGGTEVTDAGQAGGPEFEQLDLDGQCTADVDVTVDDPALVRAWDHGCPFAPIRLAEGQTRWIVVVASLNGDDFTSGDALERAAGEGLTGQALWSTHYSSLNPNLWVVYDGPYDTEQAASDAASRIGAGSYPRELADDPSRRYCLAADGCTGERS